MNDLYMYFADILITLYENEDIPQDLYQYGLYSLSIIIPLVVLVFCLACIYKLLGSILEGVR